MADIRELIHIDDVMEDKSLSFGPNGGLIFCMEYLANNFEWLQEQLYEEEDDYILFDCPGQIELYTHIPVMKMLVEKLLSWDFHVCVVFLLDAQFLVDAAKFVSGSLCALSTMINLEVPHVNVLTKMDLLSKKSKKNLNRYLEPELNSLLMEEFQEEEFGIKFKSINKAIAQLLDDFSLVHFIPLDYTKEESINDLLIHIDSTIQYGEDLEPKEIRDEIHEADFKDQEENYNN
ncbi:GPN-loop GTPase 3-like isoform X2 [Physella acuta]|nr:GPN-loop GTPase 3-like isoform X2 [Physella acuta]XP_059161922.1 GPN-loop GTPase 3-like isoform X2 [Physella acuta]XP_059161931.1 GPN-loop GTPase 3-like isoform X2 [Physella acuta]